MDRREKLIQKILNGKSGITPDEAVKVLEMLDFRTSPSGG